MFMSVKDSIQNAMKDALRNKDAVRLNALRMAKGALLHKEKEGAREGGLSEEEATAVLRGEVRKRQQSMETYREHNRPEEVAKLEQEIAILEEFLPQQLDEAALEAHVRAYLAEHPEINHAGKLTGALKKDLGDRADGKMLNEVCRRVLEGA